MKMLAFLCVAVMILACEADQGTDNPNGFLGPCTGAAWIDALSGGYCTFDRRDRCEPISGGCGWGTQRVRYQCGDFGECSCESCCWVPCDDFDPPTCERRFKEECTVVQKCPCSKTCGVGNYMVQYFCPNIQPPDVTCLEECCCKPCEGRGLFKPARPCRGDVVVPIDDRAECCPFTLFESASPDGSDDRD